VNTYTSIDQIIDEAVSGVSGYPEARQPIAALREALSAREDAIVAAVREYAQGRGLSGVEVDSILETVGLVPGASAEVEEENPAVAEALSALDAMAAQIADLRERLAS
jgi:hypothetical protein